MDIRRIRVDEAPLVRALLRTAVDQLAERFPEDDIGISEQGLEIYETLFRIGAMHQDQVTLVAVEGEEVVGFTCAEVSRHGARVGMAGEIDWFWVRPGPDHAEIERRLAEEVVAWLRDRGAGIITKMDDAANPEREPWQALGFAADTVRYALYES